MSKERQSSEDPIRAIYEAAAEIARLGQQIEGKTDRISIYRIPKLQLPSLPREYVDPGHLYVAFHDSIDSFNAVGIDLMFQARIKGEDRKAGFDICYGFDQTAHDAFEATPFYVPNTPIGLWGDHVLMDFVGQWTQSRIITNIIGVPDDIMDIRPNGKVTRQFFDTIPRWKPGEDGKRANFEERFGKTSDTRTVPNKRLNVLIGDCVKHIKIHPENNVTEVFVERMKQ